MYYTHYLTFFFSILSRLFQVTFGFPQRNGHPSYARLIIPFSDFTLSTTTTSNPNSFFLIFSFYMDRVFYLFSVQLAFVSRYRINQGYFLFSCRLFRAPSRHTKLYIPDFLEALSNSVFAFSERKLLCKKNVEMSEWGCSECCEMSIKVA